MPVGALKLVICGYNETVYTVPFSPLPPPSPLCQGAMCLIVYTAHIACHQVVTFISDDHQLAGF